MEPNILLEIENFAHNAGTIAQTALENFNQSIAELNNAAAQLVNEWGVGIGAAGMAITYALHGLPQTAQ